ncbi:MAG: DNA polymerase III subunit gamma/tau [Candidatus Dormiibacterota bacterium]
MSSENSVRQTLYLKYRPQRFGELVGQEVVATTLRNAVREGRLSHAFLFTGIRGTGKTSAARILARAINCEALEDGEPCGVCPPCLAISQNRSLDVIEIDAATNRGIDEIRDLRERAQFLPSQFRTKVYIIDEAHMLTTEAGNAFLKTLEEPPEHACFILATTEPQKLADTVLSRCQRFDFRRIPVDAMAARLASICTAEGVTATPDAVALVAEAGAGSLRDALSLLDRLLGLADGELNLEVVQTGLGMADPHALARLAAALARADMASAWGELHQLQSGGVEPRQLIRSLGSFAKAQLWRELSPAGGPAGAQVKEVAAPPGFWLDLMTAAAAAGSELRRADDPWMSLEASLLRLGLASSSSSSSPGGGGEPAVSPQVVAPPVSSVPERALESVAETPEAPLPAVAPSADELGGGAPGRPGPALPGPPTIDPVEASATGDGVQRWPEILAWLGRDNIPVQALLKSGRPASHQDGVLTLEFDEKFDFHVRQMESTVNRTILERACLEVLGQEVAVKVVKSAPGSAASGSDLPTDDSETRSSALSQAMNVFPGSRLTRLGTGNKG